MTQKKTLAELTTNFRRDGTSFVTVVLRQRFRFEEIKDDLALVPRQRYLSDININNTSPFKGNAK